MSDSLLVVVKIGSSSVTSNGAVSSAALSKLCAETASLRSLGHRVVIVTSGAIAAGRPALGIDDGDQPSDDTLRAASAVGQISLMRAYQASLAEHGLLAGQVLLAPTDFMFRRRYLKSRGTLGALLDLGVVPVINENDAIADDEIRFGDNDRLSALVAHLIEADLLVMLTDTAGLFTADPRVDAEASLIEEILQIDQTLEALAGGPRSGQSRGGMASKLAAAKIAAWSGVETVIAAATRPDVLVSAVQREHGVGTRFVAREGRLPARKLWIAFALPASGVISVDAGARHALEHGKRSLLAAGVREVRGTFGPDDAVEIAEVGGAVFAKGQVRWTSDDLRAHAGKRTPDLPETLVDEVVHRDDLVVLP
jgi:glutamate 5-kinase